MLASSLRIGKIIYIDNEKYKILRSGNCLHGSLHSYTCVSILDNKKKEFYLRDYELLPVVVDGMKISFKSDEDELREKELKEKLQKEEEEEWERLELLNKDYEKRKLEKREKLERRLQKLEEEVSTLKMQVATLTSLIK